MNVMQQSADGVEVQHHGVGDVGMGAPLYGELGGSALAWAKLGDRAQRCLAHTGLGQLLGDAGVQAKSAALLGQGSGFGENGGGVPAAALPEVYGAEFGEGERILEPVW